MPLIKPLKNESGKDFVKRCMSDEKIKQEYKDNKQRFTVCYKTYENKDDNRKTK